MAHNTIDFENYSSIIKDDFTALTVSFDEIVNVVKENSGKKLDLTICMEDFEKAKKGFSELLVELAKMNLPEKSIILKFEIDPDDSAGDGYAENFSLAALAENAALDFSFLVNPYEQSKIENSVVHESNGIELIKSSVMRCVPIDDSRIEKEPNDGELRSFFPEDNKSDGNKNRAYTLCRKQNSRREVMFAGKQKKEIENVKVAAFAPARVKPQEDFYVRVVLYNNTAQIKFYKKMHNNAKTKTYTPLKYVIPKGTKVQIILTMIDTSNHNRFYQEKKNVSWNGEKLESEFQVPLSKEKLEDIILGGKVTIKVDGGAEGLMSFQTKLLRSDETKKELFAKVESYIVSVVPVIVAVYKAARLCGWQA